MVGGGEGERRRGKVARVRKEQAAHLFAFSLGEERVLFWVLFLVFFAYPDIKDLCVSLGTTSVAVGDVLMPWCPLAVALSVLQRWTMSATRLALSPSDRALCITRIAVRQARSNPLIRPESHFAQLQIVASRTFKN